MPQPVLAMSVGDRAADRSRAPTGRSSRAVMSWLVRLSAASSSARRALSACRRACSTAEASGRATSHQDLHVGVREGARLAVGDVERADHLALREQRRQDRRPEAAPRQQLAAHRRDGRVGGGVVHPSRRPLARHPRGEGPGRRHAEIEDLGQRGARGHVEDPELPALAIEERHAEGVEADEPRDRLRGLAVDAIERQGGRGERHHLVDDLETDGALVQAPDVLEGVAELAREARRDRLAAEPARAARPEQHEAADRARRSRRGPRSAAAVSRRPEPGGGSGSVSTPHAPRAAGSSRAGSTARGPSRAARPTITSTGAPSPG